MAIIIPGSMAQEARGKVGGIVFSRNKGGQYVKGFAAPTNPNTSLQSAVRSTFASLTNTWWDVLTEPERTSWEDLAAANPIQNRLGQSITLSGLNMYIRFNQLRLLADLPREDNAPISFLESGADPAFEISAMDQATGNIAFNFNDALPWASVTGEGMIVFQGKGVSPGRSRFHGPWRILGVIDGDGTVPATSPGLFTVPVWTLVGGQKAWLDAAIIEAGRFPSSRFIAGPIVVT